MKKNFLILGICFFSFFFFFDNAKASDERIVPYDNGYKNFKSQNYVINFGGVDLDNVEEAMKELNDVLNENNIHYIMNVNFSGSYGTYRFSDIVIYEYSTSSVNFEVSDSSTDSNRYELSFLAKSNSITRATISSKTIYQNFGSTGEVSPVIRDLIEYIKSNKHLPLSSSDVQYVDVYNFSSFGTYVYPEGINSSMIYSSNMTINLTKLTKIDGLKINDVIYRENSIMPTYMNTLGYGYEKENYTENLRTDSSGIDKIEYTFDLDNKSNIIHEFNFSTSWISSIARSKLFGSPYLEYKKDNIVYKLPMDNVCISTLDEYSYCDTQINNFVDIQELKFVVNFNNINNLNGNSEVLIHFDSSLNFNRNIIYVDNENSNYVEVDFTNKYGVLLIPKLRNSDYNQEVYSDLYYLGKGLKISLYDSIDTTKEPVHSEYGAYSVGNMWGKFEYLFKFNNYNQYLFFMNNNYLIDDETKKVRYDKRYFVHSICSSSDNCEKVINPNTGEEVVIKPPDMENDSTSDNSLFSMFHFFEKPIKFIFDGIGTLYNDYTLPIVQKYWYFGFGFTVFIIILKLFF